MKKDFCFAIAVFLFLLAGGLLFLKKPLTLFLTKAFLKETVYELAQKEVVEKIKKQTGRFDEHASQAIFLNKPVTSPLVKLPREERVLGEKTPEKKWIEVDIGNQRLKAHEEEQVVFDFPISSGKWAPTPQGDFRIWIKIRYSLMDGGSVEDGSYYYLPNVPYVMYFYGAYGIHGTYWHNNFGTPMSHGCVNLSMPDAAALFAWADPPLASDKTVAYPTQDNPGTKVVIHQ